MLSLGFWFAAGVCLFLICALCAYKLGKALGKCIMFGLGFVLVIWLIVQLFEFMQVLLILVALGLYFILIGYCIYSIYRQIRYYKKYDIKYHILLVACIIVLLCHHYILPFIIFGGVHLINDAQNYK